MSRIAVPVLSIFYVLTNQIIVMHAQRRLKDARAELSNAEAEVRVERHTAEQLRADIAHRAQQFKLLKDQITGVQNMMEESRKASEVPYKLL